jgi:predicted alpha/beta hydrolase family esterase
MVSTTVLLLPGFGDSGPDHWQSVWEKRHGYLRVRQRDWQRPDSKEWELALHDAVVAAGTPVILAAHSLACVTVAHFAQHHPTTQVVGALLVAPADVESDMHTPDEVRGFSPIPRLRLPFPSILVASRTDPYVRFARAQQLAEAWGSRLVDAGRSGHLNTDSGHTEWPEGHALLQELRDVGASGPGARP